MARRFSNIENCWVDLYRQVIFSNTCFTSPSGTWRQVRYDNGDIRYINLDASSISPSAIRVRTLSADDWVLSDCPDCCDSDGGGGGGGDASAANQVEELNRLGDINDPVSLDPSDPATINSLLKGILNFLIGIQPASGAEEVVPDDVNNLSLPSRALFIGTGGDVSVVINGVDVLFRNVPDGTRLDVIATRVNFTGTSASDIVALY